MAACEDVTYDEMYLIYNAMSGRWKLRNQFLWMLGCHTGYRISELLSLRVEDVWENEKPKDVLIVKKENMKRSQPREIPPPIVQKVKELLIEYIEHLYKMGFASTKCYLFPTDAGTALSRTTYYKILKSVCRALGLQDRAIATHTMRARFVMVNFYNLKDKEEYKHDTTSLLLNLRKITGHATVESLQHYLRTELNKTISDYMNDALNNPKY